MPKEGNRRSAKKTGNQRSTDHHRYRQSVLRHWPCAQRPIKPTQAAARLRGMGSTPGDENRGSVMGDAKMQVYEVRPRKDHRGVDLISDALPFARLWYGEPDAISYAIGYEKFFSRLHDAVIRVYDETGNVIEVHEHTGDFKE